MPDKPSYLVRLPAILAEARASKPIPFFRRGDIEALFGLKRRQAIKLMHKVGAIRVSQEIAVDQRDLISWIERLAASPESAREEARQVRVVERIVELKAEAAARARKIALPDGPPFPGMPQGVTLSPGTLSIEFKTGQELLERLFALARVLARHPTTVDDLAGCGGSLNQLR
jgi:hypothetical protein